MPPRRQLTAILILLAILIAAVAVELWGRGLGGLSEDAKTQIMALRQGRALMGLIVGAALAVSGVMLQSLLRNPLASPDLLGLASGAGLGIMLVAFVGDQAGLGIAGWSGSQHSQLLPSFIWSTSCAAVVGSLGALAIVFLLSQRRGLLDPVTLVLVGVVVSIICSSCTLLVKSLIRDQGLAAGRLLLGDLQDIDDVGRPLALGTGVVTIVGIAIGVLSARAMDAAALGEDEARSVGVPLGLLRAVLFITAGVLSAASVVLAGPIGFVGLICPHAVRLMAGPGHRTLVIGAALAGAALVIIADVLAKFIDLGAGHPPIGVLTSLVGGPVLILLLRKGRAS